MMERTTKLYNNNDHISITHMHTPIRNNLKIYSLHLQHCNIQTVSFTTVANVYLHNLRMLV